MIIDKDEEPDDNIDSPEFRKKVERARKEPRKKATRNLNPEKKPQSPRFMIVIHMLSQTLKTELEANASCALSQHRS